MLATVRRPARGGRSVLGACGLPAVAALLLCAPASPASILRQDARKSAALERAEAKVEKAQAQRDEIYAALVAEYEAAEAWIQGESGEKGDAPPAVLRAYFEGLSVPVGEQAARREGLRALGPFHELWNKELYRLSRPARAYSAAMADLESAFLAVERLRHPERFQRGFDTTPPGMALVPGEKYLLGPATGDILEQPALQRERSVKLRQFYLDRREVNCADYAKFLLAQPLALREEHLPEGWSLNPEGDPLYPEGRGLYPVTGVTWLSASRYADWIGCRLPTEDEWEAAAAGEERRRYPLGAHFSSSKVNCLANGANGPRPPAEYAEDHTPLGVLCLTGNVREWTASGFNGKEVKDPGPNAYAAVRGGSYLDEPDACQSVYRWLFPARETFPHVGFRCAKDVR